MPNFSLTNKALGDLKNIARYTQQQWGIEQRVKYLNMLDACFGLLAGNPLLGKDRSDIYHGYRGYPLGTHLIFFREEVNGIVIVRILHQSMDTENRLTDI